jgi:hypothetical protein
MRPQIQYSGPQHALELPCSRPVFALPLEQVIEGARRDGKYDEGIADLTGATVTLEEPEALLWRDPHTGATTRTALLRVDRGMSFEAAKAKLDEAIAQVPDDDRTSPPLVPPPRPQPWSPIILWQEAHDARVAAELKQAAKAARTAKRANGGGAGAGAGEEGERMVTLPDADEDEDEDEMDDEDRAFIVDDEDEDEDDEDDEEEDDEAGEEDAGEEGDEAAGSSEGAQQRTDAAAAARSSAGFYRSRFLAPGSGERLYLLVRTPPWPCFSSDVQPRRPSLTPFIHGPAARRVRRL